MKIVVNYARVTMVMYSMTISISLTHIHMHDINSLLTCSMLATNTHAHHMNSLHYSSFASAFNNFIPNSMTPILPSNGGTGAQHRPASSCSLQGTRNEATGKGRPAHALLTKHRRKMATRQTSHVHELKKHQRHFSV